MCGGLSGPAQPLLLALSGAGAQAVPPACGGPSVPLVHIQALTQPGARCPAVCTPRPPRRATRRAWTVEPPVDGGCCGLCQDVPRALTSGWGSWGAHHPACPSQGPRVRWCWPHVPPGPAETAVSVGIQRTTRASPGPAPRAGRVSPGVVGQREAGEAQGPRAGRGSPGDAGTGLGEARRGSGAMGWQGEPRRIGWGASERLGGHGLAGSA